VSTSDDQLALAERFCLQQDLSTYDPYDIWKTTVGFRVKDFFNRHAALGLAPAALLSLFDTYLNNERRRGYRRQEYPIVRAWAALVLLNLHTRQPRRELIDCVRTHLEWLRDNAKHPGAGVGWGLGFRWPVLSGMIYEADWPLATMTPYALWAFVAHHEVTGDGQFLPVIRSIYRFFDRDLVAMEETAETFVPSYAPIRDRRVVNVVSYVLISFVRLLPYLEAEERARARLKIGKLFRYIELQQRADGSWLYSPEGKPFIDCFHSCIVVRNVLKAHRSFGLPGAEAVVRRGYDYITQNFRDRATGLFRRFALENKPSLGHFDLYDNAEVIHMARLMDDLSLADSVQRAVETHFVRGSNVYSQLDRFGRLHNRNTLRWAVMPYLYAISMPTG
jgi:hypothetical protein